MTPGILAKGNDLTVTVGPIRGRDPTDGIMKHFAGLTVDAWLATAADSDTALGGNVKTFSVLADAKFLVFFEAGEVDTAIAAINPPAVADQALWCIVKAAGDFRVAVPLVYKTARVA